MPHQCTNCGRVFADGSKEMLSGCPDCGGNKFQFQPAGADVSPPDPDASPPDPPGGDSSVARTVGKTAATVRDIVGGSADPDPNSGPPSTDTADPSVEHDEGDAEDAAQASARTDVVSPDELPSDTDSTSDRHQSDPVGPSRNVSTDRETAAPRDSAAEPDPDERPDLAELRKELNDQFESIKVLEPGQYELNLMELYDREEYIVALQEDGRYSIQVPETLRE